MSKTIAPVMVAIEVVEILWIRLGGRIYEVTGGDKQEQLSEINT